MAARLRSPARSIEVTEVGHYWRGSFFAMGSPCEVLIESSSAREARQLTALVAAEAWRVEDKFSRYLAGNIIDQINRAEGRPVEVDEETARLLNFAAMLHAASEQRFDITSGVLRRVWTFDGSNAVPAAEAIAAVLEQVGWQRVAWAEPVLTMPAGMEIDLGGIGKEYAVDQAVQRLVDNTDVPCLVNFGGDLAVSRAPARRPCWLVGLESLQGPQQSPQTLLQLRSGALATSGDTRRFLLKNGIRYGHIIDPRSGWPVAHAPASITVAADTCVQAGALCTLAMLQGAAAEQFLGAEDVRHWITRE